MKQALMERRLIDAEKGFTLIEVMITIVVLAFGLLGFAMLQTTALRFSQSSNHRTQATMLASDLLDQMRANRLAAAQYAGTHAATNSNCVPQPSITPTNYLNDWRCRMGRALGLGATATVTYSNGTAGVVISWGDQYWDPSSPNLSFEVTTGL